MSEERPAAAAARPRLFDVVRDAIRRRHFRYRTEETYLQWVLRFILLSGKGHPRDMGAVDVTAFLNHVAQERAVAASTQNQALAARLSLCKEMLAQPLCRLVGLEHAKHPAHQPAVSSHSGSMPVDCIVGRSGALAARILPALRMRTRQWAPLRCSPPAPASG